MLRLLDPSISHAIPIPFPFRLAILYYDGSVPNLKRLIAANSVLEPLKNNNMAKPQEIKIKPQKED